MQLCAENSGPAASESHLLYREGSLKWNGDIAIIKKGKGTDIVVGIDFMNSKLHILVGNEGSISVFIFLILSNFAIMLLKYGYSQRSLM